ncbi:MAG: diguanylate cyclase, partial [Pseudomonadota bacterium]
FLLRREARAEIRADLAKEDATSIANLAADIFWRTDPDGIIEAAGGRLMPDLVPDIEGIIGQHCLDLVELAPAELAKMHRALEAREPCSDIRSEVHAPGGQTYTLSVSATPRFDENGKINGYLGFGTDVTDRVLAQKELEFLAEHDPLTGLANRRAFTNRIDREFSLEPTTIALLAIDLDGFKTVNDRHGHDIGDALLKIVADRIHSVTRQSDWAARMGGDEFVLVAHNIRGPEDACRIAERIVEAIGRPFQIGALQIEVGASVGIACPSDKVNGPTDLVKFADLALYDAKAQGKACYRIFSKDLSGPRSTVH